MVLSNIKSFTNKSKCGIIYCHFPFRTKGGRPLDFLLQYDYRAGDAACALNTLHDLAEEGTEAIICRIRCSADNVLFVHPDTTMTRLCSCDEYVSELQFQEIRAMMRLCGYYPLTLEEILNGYRGSTRLILHFRCFRPRAQIISRIVQDPRFSLGTDSPEQLAVFAAGYSGQRTVGFACHLTAAQKMAESGASEICMYGRDVDGFGRLDFSDIRIHCPLWYEVLHKPEHGLDEIITKARHIGFDRVTVPLDYIV